MTNAETQILNTVLGTRNGALRTMPSPYRDVIGSRGHKAALAFEANGWGKVTNLDHIAFIFETNQQLAS